MSAVSAPGFLAVLPLAGLLVALSAPNAGAAAHKRPEPLVDAVPTTTYFKDRVITSRSSTTARANEIGDSLASTVRIESRSSS
jgi:hypothetical protein